MEQSSFPSLVGHQYISLTTFRKNGQGVSTPVWFAERDGKLYVYTDAKAWKLKRITNNPHVTVAPCTFRGKLLGEVLEGSARVLTTPEERKLANDTLNSKYGFIKRFLNFLARLMGGKEEDDAYIEIAPAS
ncbi:MAG: PPOX class F420-dependent oxidoreductase [Anaerolineae bacterium]